MFQFMVSVLWNDGTRETSSHYVKFYYTDPKLQLINT